VRARAGAEKADKKHYVTSPLIKSGTRESTIQAETLRLFSDEVKLK